MTEHVHEWRVIGSIGAMCRCGKTMNRSECNARLNENETLKADKRLLMHVVHGRAMASSLPKHLKEGKDVR